METIQTKYFNKCEILIISRKSKTFTSPIKKVKIFIINIGTPFLIKKNGTINTIKTR